MRFRSFATGFIALSGIASAAPPPILERTAATICAVESKAAIGEWRPTRAQIRVLENSLGVYFAKLPGAETNLPAPNLVYARQYSGVVREGKRLIAGRFYPAGEPIPRFAKTGACWVTADGGNRYWDVYFDPKTLQVIGHGVNGVA
ncbi:hypothetical protein [Roseateles sp.]|uniref:hypothetical protein n=1 Tax=Roseateles sp. TaxID=1971397 RepID=UPI003264908F